MLRLLFLNGCLLLMWPIFGFESSWLSLNTRMRAQLHAAVTRREDGTDLREDSFGVVPEADKEGVNEMTDLVLSALRADPHRTTSVTSLLWINTH